MMMKFDLMDTHAIQECLLSYKKIIEWMPVTCPEELDLKDDRMKTIEYLCDKCEVIFEESRGCVDE